MKNKKMLKYQKLLLAEILSNIPVINLTENEQSILSLLLKDEQLTDFASEIR